MPFNPDNEMPEGGQDALSPAAFDGFHHDACRSIGGQHHPRGWVAPMPTGRRPISTNASDFRGHKSRRQVGHRNPFGVQFVPKGIRQRFHGMLAHGVYPGGGYRDKRIDRSHNGQPAFGQDQIILCGTDGSDNTHHIHFELSTNLCFRELIESTLGGIACVRHHHVDSPEGIPGQFRQGLHIVGLHDITCLNNAPNIAGLFDLFGKLCESIDPSCPENEVVVSLREHLSQGFPDTRRSAGDQGNGSVGSGMGLNLHMHSVRSQRRVGGDQLIALVTSEVRLVCLVIEQSPFRGKKVLLPRHHGHGLAHQESSPTIPKSLF